MIHKIIDYGVVCPWAIGMGYLAGCGIAYVMFI